MSARGRLRDLLAAPLARVAGPWLRRRPRGLFYHLAGQARAHTRALYACKSAEQLSLDLQLIKERFHVASHEEVAWHQRREKALPPGSVTLSVDDGLAECFTTIRPLLLEHGLPCSFFVCERFLDNRSMMHRNRAALALDALSSLCEARWDELRGACSRATGIRLRARDDLASWLRAVTFRQEQALDATCAVLGVDVERYLEVEAPYLSGSQLEQLHRDGFSIGAHSLSHPELWLCEWSRVEAEVRGSCLAVRERTGASRVPFAFPFTGAMLSRRRLAALHASVGVIDLMYDTDHLRRDRDFIFHRIPADAPGDTPGVSNVPELLRRAEGLEPLRAARRLLRPRRG